MDKLTDTSREAIVQAIDENLLAFRLLFGKLPSAKLFKEKGVMYLDTNIPYDKWNGVLVTNFTENDADKRIKQVKDYFCARKRSMSWWVGPNTKPSKLGNHLEKNGFFHYDASPAMAYDLLQYQTETHFPEGLTIKPVQTNIEIQDFLEVLKSSYRHNQIGMDALSILLSKLVMEENPSLLNYVGYVKGRPVTCASILMAAGVAGIHFVGTNPVVRGQGFATTITLYVMHIALKLGFRIAVLRASEMGFPIYQRLGFVEYFKIHQYILEMGIMRKFHCYLKYYLRKGYDKFTGDALWFS